MSDRNDIESESDSDSELESVHNSGSILTFSHIDETENYEEDCERGSENVSDIEEEESYIVLPQALTSLRQVLLGDYRCPPSPPICPPIHEDLTPTEMLSLRHYVAWKKSNGTVKAYNAHAAVLREATMLDILSLHNCQQLAIKITELQAYKVDICSHSCVAYAGPYENHQSCPYVKEGKTCGLPRYKQYGQKLKPIAQMMCLPIMATIRAMFANLETASLLRHRDKCLQEALKLVAQATTYFDFGNSEVHKAHYHRGLFQDSRDIAFAISSDGAQLTMKKQSDTWLVIIILLNLPPEIRYKSSKYLIPFAIPGPYAPGDIESFFYSTFQEMMRASEGIWTWDAVDSSYFISHAHLCMVLGDMLGSAKLNGMAGHSGVYGDRFSMVKGARSSQAKGAKAQYYPISLSCSQKYNSDRPVYDFENIPMRQEQNYWSIIENLTKASNKTARNKITKESGVTRLPLCAASQAFIHPTFFPIDPFHLFYENNVPFFWDLWMTLSKTTEPIHVSESKGKKFGSIVVEAMSSLPPSFCGPIRDPYLKRQSQYKIYEWMALAHWYIVPIGLELNFNPTVLQNYAYFVEGIEFAMTIASRSKSDLNDLHNIFVKFLSGFQKIYIGEDPEKISRARLCVFQLIHVAKHIVWNGSIRIGSQATVERTIGEMGHKIHSKKAPFANLANLIYERELIKLLLLYFPELNVLPEKKPSESRFIQKLKISKKEKDDNEELYHHLEAICLWIGQPLNLDLKVQRYGKFQLLNGFVLRSKLSEDHGKPPARSSCYFEAFTKGSLVFGRALAFYEVAENNKNELLMVYQPLHKVMKVLTALRGVWSNSMAVLPVKDLHNLIGILTLEKKIYILRKHPGLQWMSDEEKEVNSNEECMEDE